MENFHQAILMIIGYYVTLSREEVHRIEYGALLEWTDVLYKESIIMERCILI